MHTESKKTPLYDWHAAHQAKMENFGGFQMPMWYASAKSEHLAVLTHAGLFDTSHMDTLTVRGAQAYELLQYCFTKDMDRCIGPKQNPLAAGRCVYGTFLDEKGHAVDDAIIFKMDADDFMVVVNAGMGAVIAGHLEKYKAGKEAVVSNLSGKLGKIDLQGPNAVRILRGLLSDPEQVLDSMPYFSFKGVLPLDEASAKKAVAFKQDIPALVSRTGYTGEVGFEIFCPADQVVALWEAVLVAGAPLGIVPCGLAARDSLRAGAVLPLSHQDIGHWPFINHPWSFALPWDDDQKGFTKSFIGDAALLEAREGMHTQAFVGFDPRKIPLGETSVVDDQGNEIGTVLTCATDMGIGRHDGTIYSVASPDQPQGFKAAGLSCGFVKVSAPLTVGQRIQIKNKRRAIEVEIVEDIRPARTARKPLATFLAS